MTSIIKIVICEKSLALNHAAIALLARSQTLVEACGNVSDIRPAFRCCPHNELLNFDKAIVAKRLKG